MAPFVVLQRICNALYINLSYILESITCFSYYLGIDLAAWHILFICNFGFEYGVQCKKKKRICIKFIAHVKVLFCYPLRYEIQIKCEKSLKLDCKM